MKKLLTPLLLLALLLTSGACTKNTPAPAGSAIPDLGPGVVTLQTATVIAQGGTRSSGTLAIIRTPAGQELVQLNDDFMTEFHTGSLGVYLAKSDANIREQQAAGAGNVLKVGTIVMNGKQRLEIPTPGAYSGFSHVAFYCEAAKYNFAAAALH